MENVNEFLESSKHFYYKIYFKIKLRVQEFSKTEF